MAYCILRIKKLHGNGNVASSLAHMFRTRKTENADPNRMIYNWYYPNSYIDGDKTINADPEYREKMRRQAIAIYKKRLQTVGKIRKNAVRAVEMVMTFSPEAMDDPNFNATAYMNDCQKWAQEMFGSENIFAFSYHRDETTPHVSLFFTPIRDGKLNAREIFGGRKMMIAMQDAFFEDVGAKYGLERGLPKALTKAEHKDIKEYYKDIEKAKANERKAKLVDEPCRILGLDGTEITCSDGLYKGVQRAVAKVKEQHQFAEEFQKAYQKECDRFDALYNNPKALKQRLKELEREEERYYGR